MSKTNAQKKITNQNLIEQYQNDWNKFADDVLGVNLDPQQKKILSAVQKNNKVSVRSGNSRGKDFLAAVAALCFLYLFNPSKVICTAPTQRQVFSIMMSEIGSIYDNSNVKLGGKKLKTSIKFKHADDHYLIGFKASDKEREAWQGFHSENIMVIVSEASGISTELFENIEGILTGNSHLLIVFNPLDKNGESYSSITDPDYVNFRLNSLNAPNVINYQRYVDGKISLSDYDKLHIPGQVDWHWIDDKVDKKGWSELVPTDEHEESDFNWRGKYYRPLDPFLIRVLGKYGQYSEGSLIPLSWIERSHKLWESHNRKHIKGRNIYGLDVAGQGRDKTVLCKRNHNYVSDFHVFNFPVDDEIHMKIAGKVIDIQRNRPGHFFIDTIGEGAGVFSRLAEQNVTNVFSCKGSFSAKNLTDYFEFKEFSRMRDYLIWTIRDSLDPKIGFDLMLPPNNVLDDELLALEWSFTSSGKVKIINLDDFKNKLGHSPDLLSSLAKTFTPV